MNLRRNTIFGALGFVLPSLVVLAAYPTVLRHLGPGDMGVFILATSLAGSFAFLEFGLTTVTTKLVAEASAVGDPGRTSDAIVTTLAFYLGLGVAGAVVLWGLSPLLANWVDAPDSVAATRAFQVASLLLVPTYATNVAGAVLKGLHRFDLATAQSTFASATTWGGAVAVTLLPGGGIVRVMAATLVANGLVAVASWLVTIAQCRVHGIHLGRGRPRGRTLRDMFRFGIFMSLNGLIGVLVNQVQNLIMARLLSSAAIAIWGTAVAVVSKISQLTNAAFEVVLPVSAELAEPAARSEEKLRILRSIYLKALGLSFVASAVASVSLYALAPPLIRLWLHSSIDGEVSSVLRILCLGLAVNGVTPVVFHLLNGVGRPEVNTAAITSGAIILYAALFWMSRTGLTLERFALASAISLVLNGVLYFAYAELVVWRRWLLPSRPGDRTARASS